MDPKQFYQKLTELTYWDFPNHGRATKTHKAKPTVKTRKEQARLIARWQNPLEQYPGLLDSPLEIEEEPEDWDEQEQDDAKTQIPERESLQPNATQPPRIIALRTQPTACDSCDRTYTERVMTSQWIKEQQCWRQSCSACGEYWYERPKNNEKF